MAIKSLADVRPGDIFLGPIGGGLGLGIRAAQVIVDGGWRVGPLHVEHIGIVVEASRTLPPGTVRHRETGRYYVPGESWHPSPDDDCDTYETGVITAPRMVQAMPHGAEEIDLSVQKHWTPRVAFARIPEDYPGQAADAAAIARAMIGTPYSFASYAALALYRWGLKAPRLTEWIGRRREPFILEDILDRGSDRDVLMGLQLPREAICSVLADQAWSLAGKRVMDDKRAPQAVTPSQLGQRLLREMDGVEWGFPR